jgi:hypothetical protein
MSAQDVKNSTDNVICPWCDYAHEDLDDYCLPDDEGATWGECRECGKPFEVTKTADNKFHTTKKQA